VLAGLNRERLLTGLFQALPAPWPPEVGTLVLDRLARHREERGLAHIADLAAYAVPPECLDHPLTTGDLDPQAPPWLRRLVDTLVFRRAMHQELP
jgi:hypothetical protein